MQVVKSMTQEETSYNMQIIALRHQIEIFQDEIIKKSKDYDIVQVDILHILIHLTMNHSSNE